ncbi:hypothetical protein SDC9_180317 [bioreactor metagenome]|uniref:Holin n=1 Tax=bioreactor metagenome TaxID=1076179 RepID=A0A645H2X5_9ZZZZ
MEIINYIMDNALVIIPALWILGTIIKAIPFIPDWTIPLILLAAGVPAAMAIIGWNVDGAIQGVLVTGAAVYGNQLVKQLSKAGSDDNVDEE